MILRLVEDTIYTLATPHAVSHVLLFMDTSPNGRERERRRRVQGAQGPFSAPRAQRGARLCLREHIITRRKGVVCVLLLSHQQLLVPLCNRPRLLAYGRRRTLRWGRAPLRVQLLLTVRVLRERRLLRLRLRLLR